MKGLVLSIIVVSGLFFLTQNAFAENLFYGSSSFEKLPSIISDKPSTIELKMRYTEGPYSIMKLTPVFDVSPESAKQYMQIKTKPIEGVYRNGVGRIQGTITVDPHIPYEKIFINVYFNGTDVYGNSYKSAWSNSATIGIKKQNSIGLSYEECQKQIHDQMNKTVSSIDKSKAISLAQNSTEFLSKITTLKHTFSGIFTNMTWNDSTCGDVKLKDVTVQFSALNDNGMFEKFVQVDEDPDLSRVISVRNVYVEDCGKNCPPPGPMPLDLHKTNSTDPIINAKCLDGTQFLRQGKVDIVQLGDEGKFYVNKEAKIVSSILHKDVNAQTTHLWLEITNPHQDKIEQTKQIVFGNCPARAIVEWTFTPQVLGKHKITLKEAESGSGYTTNIEVKDSSGKLVNDHILSPLRQLKSGIPIHQIQCKENYVILLKPNREFGGCFNPDDAMKLYTRGWPSPNDSHGYFQKQLLKTPIGDSSEKDQKHEKKEEYSLVGGTKIQTMNSEFCKENGGKWFAQNKECVGIPKNTCEANSGVFNECGSYCKYYPAQLCPDVCLSVCSAKQNQ